MELTRFEEASHLRVEDMRTGTILELTEGAAGRASILILKAGRLNSLAP